MEIKWIFFDLGYTLINEDMCHHKRIEQAVQALQKEGLKIQRDEFYQAMISASQSYQPPFWAVLKSLNSLINIKYPGEFEHLYPGVTNVLSNLRQKYQLGIIANQEAGTEKRLENWKISQYFDVIVSSAEAGYSKPDEHIFKIALEKSKCLAKNAVMIGDRLDNDIYPAKKLGFKTIWIRQGFGGFQKPISSDYQADIEIDNLHELLSIL